MPSHILSPSVIVRREGTLNLYELGSNNKYHLVRVVKEIPSNWTYKLQTHSWYPPTLDK
jgi:hypothetical protein